MDCAVVDGGGEMATMWDGACVVSGGGAWCVVGGLFVDESV